MSNRTKSSLPAPSINKKLSKAFEFATVITYNSSSRMVFMSDCHRGTGSNADDFTPNEKIFFAALTYYNRKKFTYFELGDGDELWENRNIDNIVLNHCDIFELISEFHKDRRYYMMYGNHDISKKLTKHQNKFSSFQNDCTRRKGPILPGIHIYESIILLDPDTGHKIFLTHGHQGDVLNDYLWRLARFLVRYLWKPLQLIGIENPTDPSLSNTKRGDVEHELMHWTKQNKQMLICGHTHRTAFAESKSIPYFNDGCCVHPHYITSIEIENNKICLVKWTIKTDEKLRLYVSRDILNGPTDLNEFYNF